MRQRFSPNYGWKEVLTAFLPANKNAPSLLEKAFKERTGHKHSISLSYGRSGLVFLLKALPTNKRTVILPSDTCVVVAHAIVLAGFKPFFIDNAYGKRQPSQQDFIDAINADTCMIIPTHLYGIPQETEDLYHYVKKNHPDIFILQDCAHSFFCRDSNGNLVTTWGDGALFGMNISKLVNSVKGGMLTLNDNTLAEKIRVEVNSSKVPSSFFNRLYVLAAAIAFTPPVDKFLYFLRSKTSLLSSQTKYFDENCIELPKDYSLPLNPFSATIGLYSLNKYDERISKRRAIAELYTQVLNGLKSPAVLWYPPLMPGATWSHYPVLVEQNNRSQFIATFEKTLKAEIGVIVDYSVADLNAYQRMNHDSCPNALFESKQITNLPLTWFEQNLMPNSPQAVVLKKITKNISQAIKRMEKQNE